MQLQMIVDGEIANGHAQTAGISIYVFRNHRGRWAIEKRADEALDEGHNGEAPGVQLVKLGSERFSIRFINRRRAPGLLERVGAARDAERNAHP